MPEFPNFDNFRTGFRDETVTIVANPKSQEEQQFFVSKAIICSRSEVFHRAFNGDFKEAEERRIELPDVDILSLQAVLYWMYTMDIPAYGQDDPPLEERFLVRLWLLSDRLIIPVLKKLVTQHLCVFLQETRFEAPTVNEIYRNTAPGSFLRRAAAYNVACWALNPRDETNGSAGDAEYCEAEDLLADVLRAVQDITVITGLQRVSRKMVFAHFRQD